MTTIKQAFPHIAAVISALTMFLYGISKANETYDLEAVSMLCICAEVLMYHFLIVIEIVTPSDDGNG